MISAIQEALGDLRGAPGVRGVAVVTADGLVAASALATGLADDVIAGLASYLMMMTNRCLDDGAHGVCTRLTLIATDGKAVFVQLEGSYLVVLFEGFAEVVEADRQVEVAADQIRRAVRVG